MIAAILAATLAAIALAPGSQTVAAQTAAVAISVGAPAHTPQMAADGAEVALTFGAGNAIYFAASHDAGRTFAAPVKVAEAGVLPLTRHRGPRIAISNGVIVISAVAGRTLSTGEHAHGLPSDGDLLVWRSRDHGQTWSKGFVVNDSPGAPTEGLHSLAAGPGGKLFAVWLDKRGTGTKLYGSHSTDSGATWTKNTLIYESPDGSICQCCHPSALIAGGQIEVMWRNAVDGARDMYLARSRDGITFSKPEKLGTGSWQLNACPMDGGGIVADGNRIVTAWRRDQEIFLASPGEKEVGLGEGVDVSIAAGYVAWSSARGIELLSIGAKSPTAIAPHGKFPNVVSVQQRALIAWEDEGRIFVDAR